MAVFGASSKAGSWDVRVVVVAALVALLLLLGPAASQGVVQVPDEPDLWFDRHDTDVDTRTTTVSPTATQLATVEALGATARWTRSLRSAVRSMFVGNAPSLSSHLMICFNSRITLTCASSP